MPMGIVASELFDGNATMGQIGDFVDSVQIDDTDVGRMSLLRLVSKDDLVPTDLMAGFHLQYGNEVREEDLPELQELFDSGNGLLAVVTNKVVLRDMVHAVVAERNQRSRPRPRPAQRRLTLAERRAQWDAIPPETLAANNIRQGNSGIGNSVKAQWGLYINYEGMFDWPQHKSRAS